MNELAHLQPLIEAHADELKQPGVISIRPGYKMENGLLTKQPAIVVTVKPGAAPAGIPATVGDVPVDVREADPAEALRFSDPAGYAKLASVRAEFRAGAFDEVDPVADDAEAAPEVEGAAAVRPQAAGKQQPYTAPAGDDGKPVPLATVRGTFPFTVHASPDAGWPTLKQFLAQTQSSLDVAMYDFTSAHILAGVDNAVAGAQTLTITLDNPAKNPTADQTDAETLETLGNDLGDRFKSAWALNRANPKINDWIFPNAYHIKVAVRDGTAVWLSSGNWNNSNQPDFDPVNAEDPTASAIQQEAKKRDRDWHIIVEHPGLAKTFQAYVLHDYEVASKDAGDATADTSAVEAQAPFPVVEIEAARKPWKFFAPLRIDDEEVEITPLLTPDPGVYQPAMLALIQSATKKLYIQLQYIHPSDKDGDEDFTALIDAVSQKIADGVDVRIITSQYQTSNGWLERLQAAGIDGSVVKIQNGVHNKGFIVDAPDDESGQGGTVALGSENWSGDGVLRNRDASVIVKSTKAALYYQQIFLHDWNNIARPSSK
jgi:phosphatidylserine/phosphatidylglycerophosphate/cardiolipin synthase-like enzyme